MSDFFDSSYNDTDFSSYSPAQTLTPNYARSRSSSRPSSVRNFSPSPSRYQPPSPSGSSIGGSGIPPGYYSGFSLMAVLTGTFDDDPPLLEELGINFGHIVSKTRASLNPIHSVDIHLMDDTDLAGPLVFCLLMGFFLLLTGKMQFGYIFGVGIIGCISIWFVMNMMSESGIDFPRSVAVLGYCLLPMVLLSGLSVFITLKGLFGMIISSLFVVWCTYSAAHMFVSVLSMKEQTALVMYPVFLVYAGFGLLAVF
eukprot:TRINITY_DN4946_c0_g1_i1.p1 TRINITY_DN4946_c0_g1~~TRINITY_DN4946_c0_g1_i1.p1  ORF type:complete len:254 (-),score=68.10 TRINITY_DN4946_c0_g1_i1:85-846(-)